MHTTDGTMINWKMMESVVNNVEILNMLVEKNGGGPYEVGKCQSLIHTLSWTKCLKKELVSTSDRLCSTSKFLINKWCAHIWHVFF